MQSTGSNWLIDLLARPILRFAAVGVVSTTLDIATLNLVAHFGGPVPLAVALGFLVGATNGYLLNSSLTFHRHRSSTEYGKYILVNLIGLTITESIVGYLHNHTGLLGLNQAKLVAVGIVFFWNYSASRMWAFR